MTVTWGEPEGLPDEGPAVLSGVKRQASIDPADVDDDVELQAIVDAVNFLVRRLPVALKAIPPADLDPLPAPAWPPSVVKGAVMLAARLWRRRNSPGGVETFGDLGPVYVRRNDPDIAQLLELGDYAPPQVG